VCKLFRRQRSSQTRRLADLCSFSATRSRTLRSTGERRRGVTLSRPLDVCRALSKRGCRNTAARTHLRPSSRPQFETLISTRLFSHVPADSDRAHARDGDDALPIRRDPSSGVRRSNGRHANPETRRPPLLLAFTIDGSGQKLGERGGLP
jgi:hypothetical protein